CAPAVTASATTRSETAQKPGTISYPWASASKLACASGLRAATIWPSFRLLTNSSAATQTTLTTCSRNCNVRSNITGGFMAKPSSQDLLKALAKGGATISNPICRVCLRPTDKQTQKYHDSCRSSKYRAVQAIV